MFNKKTKQEHIQEKYKVMCLCEDEFPMPVKDLADEATNDITPAQKIEMYK